MTKNSAVCPYIRPALISHQQYIFRILHSFTRSEMPRRSQESTCSAHAVDAVVRGFFAGALWGFHTSHEHFPIPSVTPRSRVVLRLMARNGVDCAAFFAVYSTVTCFMSSAHSRILADAMPGIAAGTFAAARANASPRQAVLVATACGGFNVLMGGMGPRRVEGT